MNWWVLSLSVFIALLFSTLAGNGQRGYRLATGTLSTRDVGACAFSLGSTAEAFVITTHPQNMACVRLRELVGRTGVLSFMPDE